MTTMERLVIDLMFRRGGNFEQCLAKCSIEADTPRGFLKAVVDAYTAADEPNRAIFCEMLGIMTIGEIWEMSEADRRCLLMDAFGTFFQRYSQMANAAATGVSA